MEEAERQRAIELMAEQEALLIAVALGQRDPDEAEGEYKRRHDELQVLLAKDRSRKHARGSSPIDTRGLGTWGWADSQPG